MMDLLHIATLRPGVDGNHPQAPNAVNYDEAKAKRIDALLDLARRHGIRADLLSGA